MSDKLFIVDAHEDIAYHMHYFSREFVCPSVPCQITLPGLKKGHIRLVFNTIFVHPKDKPSNTRKRALEQFGIYDEIYATYPEDVLRINDSSGISELLNGDKIGFLTLMEGADPIHAPSDLEEFHAMGVRIIALAWNDKNRYASGTDTGEGLSAAGMELIEKMNDLNIVLDLSHLNEKCFWQAIDITASIPIASHSNSMSLCSHPRNLTDEQVTAVAEKGGVIGILLYSPFLNSGITRATLHDVFLHTDHMVRLVGEDHVGIGTDLDGAEIGAFPEEIQTVADLPKIADTLRNNGYREERVKKIMGENFIRVIRENFQRA